MAGTIKRTNPGDVANLFVRCMLSDISDMLGGFSNEELQKTVEYFDYKCPYTGQDISVEYQTHKWVLDHLIPHNRESCGLNLYGNIIVTTREINSKKAAKSFEDFIRFDTQGTEEEKEARIQKIRIFQKEAGYFNKIKDINEIKELCKQKYDFILDETKALKNVYETILKLTPSSSNIRPERISTVNTINRINKISKYNAIQIFRTNGFSISGNVTFASENNSYGRKFWANPKLDLLEHDWWLILNDIDKRELHLFFIPTKSISNKDVYVRADKPDFIDIQINYNDYSFEDSRSKIVFKKWFKKSIKY